MWPRDIKGLDTPARALQREGPELCFCTDLGLNPRSPTAACLTLSTFGGVIANVREIMLVKHVDTCWFPPQSCTKAPVFSGCVCVCVCVCALCCFLGIQERGLPEPLAKWRHCQQSGLCLSVSVLTADSSRARTLCEFTPLISSPPCTWGLEPSSPPLTCCMGD